MARKGDFSSDGRSIEIARILREAIGRARDALHGSPIDHDFDGLTRQFGEVRSADELWVTSSSKEIVAIVTLDGAPVGSGKPGPVFRKAWQLYQEFKNEVMRARTQARAA